MIDRLLKKIKEAFSKPDLEGALRQYNEEFQGMVRMVEKRNKIMKVVLEVIEPPPYGDMLNFGGDPVYILDEWAKKNWKAIHDIAKILEEDK